MGNAILRWCISHSNRLCALRDLSAAQDDKEWHINSMTHLQQLKEVSL
jgi:hypothetical protein